MIPGGDANGVYGVMAAPGFVDPMDSDRNRVDAPKFVRRSSNGRAVPLQGTDGGSIPSLRTINAD